MGAGYVSSTRRRKTTVNTVGARYLPQLQYYILDSLSGNATCGRLDGFRRHYLLPLVLNCFESLTLLNQLNHYSVLGLLVSTLDM